MRSIVAALLLLASFQVSACMNMVQRVPGVEVEYTEFYWIGQTVVDADSVRTFLRMNERAYSADLRREANDIVIAHLYLKEFKTALALSTKLVAKHPMDYSVVITHAAALELNGRIAEAITFMEQALAINPKSHNGSEWIHLNILEARLKGGYTSPWDLIGVNLRPDSAVLAPKDVDMKALIKQVHYQIVDRLYFTPKNDPLFGALMFAYADLLQLLGHKSSAKSVREQATGFGFTYEQHPTSQPVTAPISPAHDTLAVAHASTAPRQPSFTTQKKTSTTASWLVGGLIGAIVVFIAAFMWRAAKRE